MRDDPWAEIEPPSSTEMLAARRASVDHRWDFFWARDATGARLLLFQHDATSSPTGRLPTPKGLRVEVLSAGSGRRSLVLRLSENSQAEVFLKLARDIIGVAEEAATEKEAVLAAVLRTWRWHHFLKGGPSGKLGDDAQKGLIGELLVLERHLLPILSPAAAMTCWVGPLGAPKDFEVGSVAIEAKARRGTATPFVKISSEHQLDGSGCSRLLLHVTNLSALPDGSTAEQAISLTILVRRLRASISQDPFATELFETRLSAAGLGAEEQYELDLWEEGSSHIFEVAGDFPRITARGAGVGIRDVQYSLELTACEPYRISETLGREILTGAADDIVP